MSKTLTLALGAMAAGTASAAVAADEVLALPGWTGALPSKQYSGYLNASDTSHLHYWLVESEANPATDPLVLWFNGGPGCSSLDGFFYEHGPFEIDGPDYKTLSLREYRWTANANVLYIEAPVGVGFSYSDTASYHLDDDRTANENRAAMESFFAMYPELKENKFFITGESYAGVYVPTLAEAILNGEQDGSYTGAKLSGIAVGNGCTGTEVGICGDGSQGTYYEWTYLLDTGFITEDLKRSVNAACDWEAAAVNDPNALNTECVLLLNEASKQIGHVDMYNIYGDCVSGGCPVGEEPTITSKIPLNRKAVPGVQQPGRMLARITPHGPDACIDSAAASAYLNEAAVMEAIHVRDPGFCWSICGTVKGWSYESTRTNLPRDTYPQLVSNIDVLIYNGDWDACVPYTDNEAWTENMGYAASSAWHAWSYTSALGNENQVAGYAVEYDVTSKGSGSFQFITIRGGRHEVPETAPVQAMDMLSKLMNGASF
jgi:carboxypeptidase C (cathepsin A)